MNLVSAFAYDNRVSQRNRHYIYHGGMASTGTTRSISNSSASGGPNVQPHCWGNAIPPNLRALDSGRNGKLLEYTKDALITCSGIWAQVTTGKQSLRARIDSDFANGTCGNGDDVAVFVKQTGPGQKHQCKVLLKNSVGVMHTTEKIEKKAL